MSNLVIVPRQAWATQPRRGASYVNHYTGIPSVGHWFGPGTAAEGTTASTRQAQSFMRYHMNTLGWSDIGYNFLVLRDRRSDGLATVLEGRGDNVRGAHSGNNVGNARPGVCVMLGTNTPAPTDAQLDSLCELARVKNWGRFTGHREYYSTSCPGPVLWPWIQGNRMAHMTDPPETRVKRFFFEELPYQPSRPELGGNGPYVRTYKQEAVRDEKLADLKNAGHVVSPHSGPDGEGGRLYYIFQWRPGTYGKPFQFGDWSRPTEEARKEVRDSQQARYEKATGRTMRPYSGKDRSTGSLYPRIG